MRIFVAVAACLLGRALCCSPQGPPGLRVTAIDATAGSDIVNLEIRDFADYTYFYEFIYYDNPAAECDRITLQYDWALDILQPSTDRAGNSVDLSGSVGLGFESLDLGTTLDLSTFRVDFHVGGVSMHAPVSAPGVVSGFKANFTLEGLIEPGFAVFWYTQGHMYFSYPRGTLPAFDGQSLVVCNVADGTCTTNTSPGLHELFARSESETEVIQARLRSSAVYEEAHLVFLPSLYDSCFYGYFHRVGSGGDISRISGLQDLIHGKDVVVESRTSDRLFYSGDVDSRSVGITRINLATGVSETKVFDPQVVRDLIAQSCRTLPPPMPPPVPSVPPRSQPESKSKGDPHLTFAHGGKADFRGCEGCIFNFLSARDISINVKTDAAMFMLDGAIVEGSFITEVHLTSLNRTTNEFLNMSYWAEEVGEGNWGWRMVNGSCYGSNFVLSPKKAKQCGAINIKIGYASATISLPQWEVRIESREVFNPIDGPRHRLDLAMKPTVPERDLSAWPHGIIGQSYDGDDAPMNGRQDNYSTAWVVTEAMAEGAIEGVGSDYRVADPLETRFKYSRFDSTKETSRPRQMAKPQVKSDSLPLLSSSTERSQS